MRPNHKKSSVVLLLWMVAVSLSATELPSSFIAPKSKLKNAVIPIYLSGESKAVAVVKVDRVFTEYQRKGFFRLGVLPILVLEGVEIEITNAGKTAQALASLNGWLDPDKVGRVVEFRKFGVQYVSAVTNRIEAQQVKYAAHGQWDLNAKVVFLSGHESRQANHARLHVIGPETGKLVWDSSAYSANNLFAIAQRTESISQNPK